ncbi:MAG: neutral zinc metallopeptidase [Cypionkella sp.]|nr:neutral zinc metallopeptidase [Cypionkella sp.]
MEWRGQRKSTNIEDRRGQGGIGRTAGRTGGVGVLAIVVIGYFLGVDLTPLLDQQGAPAQNQQGSATSESEREAGEFVSVVLAKTETIWQGIFKSSLNANYTAPTLVLYSQSTNSPCGGASGATGPFYCPGDQKIYLDTAFFDTMQRDLGASGDFAMAYVVAHEVAHHVQNEMGIMAQANQIRQRSDQATSNAISVRIELQADCLSGIWAAQVQSQFGTIQKGDFAEALNAAKQIGDDTLQRNAGQRPMPHTFTHGTSAQRMAWFERGLSATSLESCDTFSAANL